MPKPITDAPDHEELSGRLEKVQRLMASEGLDYYVSFDPVNIYYGGIKSFFDKSYGLLY